MRIHLHWWPLSERAVQSNNAAKFGSYIQFAPFATIWPNNRLKHSLGSALTVSQIEPGFWISSSLCIKVVSTFCLRASGMGLVRLLQDQNTAVIERPGRAAKSLYCLEKGRTDELWRFRWQRSG